MSMHRFDLEIEGLSLDQIHRIRQFLNDLDSEDLAPVSRIRGSERWEFWVRTGTMIQRRQAEVVQLGESTWRAFQSQYFHRGHLQFAEGTTAEEAVANLQKVINKKPMELL